MLELRDADAGCAAIRRLAVRGAPLIGVAAAYGLAMEVAPAPSLGALERGSELLRDARPTAVNLAWAVDRVRAAALAEGPTRLAGAAREAAEAIDAEDVRPRARRSRGTARRCSTALTGAGALRVMTHCNAGALAAIGRGTAPRRDRGARRPAARARSSPARRGRCCRARG